MEERFIMEQEILFQLEAGQKRRGKAIELWENLSVH
jgi:hypothetical protein